MKNKNLMVNKKRAFTLAEVLITLVVIGVIAAITVPTIVANYRREATSAKLKKFYSTLHQVSYRAKADGKDWNDWALDSNPVADLTNGVTGGSKAFSEYYLTPYLNKMAVSYCFKIRKGRTCDQNSSFVFVIHLSTQVLYSPAS